MLAATVTLSRSILVKYEETVGCYSCRTTDFFWIIISACILTFWYCFVGLGLRERSVARGKFGSRLLPISTLPTQNFFKKKY